ncbi:MAG TPA: AraC family transcriptional regulator [Chitinophagaceae bacterium]|nr:AraC family transcriptional regulator [Chitinophagaceae bacterium]
MDATIYPKWYFYRRLVQAKLFIDAHFDEPINLDAIADEAYFSKFHFLRMFKKTYRQTPHQYLVNVRLEKAKMLLQSAIPITQACYACGFESIPSFTTLFKKTTGFTPSQYRQQQLELKADKQSKPLKYIPACFAEKKGWIENSNF